MKPLSMPIANGEKREKEKRKQNKTLKEMKKEIKSIIYFILDNY